MVSFAFPWDSSGRNRLARGFDTFPLLSLVQEGLTGVQVVLWRGPLDSDAHQTYRNCIYCMESILKQAQSISMCDSGGCLECSHDLGDQAFHLCGFGLG